MTVHWKPVEDDVQPDTIAVYHGGEQIGTADVSDVPGMPDSIGGVAPDAVRELVADELNISTFEATYEVEYIRGQP